MSQSRVLVLLAGAALSIGAPALAQNANLDQNRAYAAELQADAAARTSGLAAGTSGHDAGGFYITDGTGDNRVSIGGTAQFRYYANFRSDDAPVGSDNGFTHGFQNNDVRLRASGNVWSKDLTYMIQGNFGSGGNFGLEEAFARYNFENGWNIMWGQFILPVYRERMVNSEYQLAVNRSQAMRYFDPSYTQGIQVGYNNEQWRLTFGFTDGTNAGNTTFNSGAEWDYSLNARLEWNVNSSDWARFNDFTSWTSASSYACLVGAAVNWETAGATNPSTGNDPNQIDYTLDVSCEGAGWNVFAAFLGSHFDPDSGAGEQDDFGLVVQGGIFASDQWEVFARYDGLFLDSDTAGPGNKKNVHFVTLGTNYYLSRDSHAAKFTGDVVLAFSKTNGLANAVGAGGLVNDTETGLLGSAKSFEPTIRLQFQVMF